MYEPSSIGGSYHLRLEPFKSASFHHVFHRYLVVSTMDSPRVFPNRHLTCQFGALDKGGQVGKIKMKSAQLHQKATNLENVSCFELENNMGKKRWQRVHVMENCNWWKEFNVRILYTSSIHWILTWLAGGWGSTESIQLQNALNTISSWDLNHSKWEIPVFQGVYLKRTGQDPRNTSTPFEAWDLGKDPKQKSTNKWQVPKRKGSFLGSSKQLT